MIPHPPRGLAVATSLRLRRWRDLIPFLLLSIRVERQARKSPGLMYHGMRGDLLQRQFCTLTIWESRQSANAFVNAEPHMEAVRRFNDLAYEGLFAEWEAPSNPVSWAEAHRRLEHPTYRYG
ncbi:MAG: hypothetical protein ACKVVP_20760 [Chloroflexota bacterium]